MKIKERVGGMEFLEISQGGNGSKEVEKHCTRRLKKPSLSSTNRSGDINDDSTPEMNIKNYGRQFGYFYGHLSTHQSALTRDCVSKSCSITIIINATFAPTPTRIASQTKQSPDYVFICLAFELDGV